MAKVFVESKRYFLFATTLFLSFSCSFNTAAPTFAINNHADGGTSALADMQGNTTSEVGASDANLGQLADLPGVKVDVTPPCQEDKDCADLLNCTDNFCDKGFCTYQIHKDQCLIDGICYAKNAEHPSLGKCAICDPTKATNQWTRYTCVVTAAGTNDHGNNDGPLATAKLNQPVSLAIDAAGAIYVGEQGNYDIRKITNGQLQTIAGGQIGFLNGEASQAQFNHPAGLAIDQNNNLFIADRNNYRLRQLSGNQVLTYAGSGSIGQLDGSLGLASFNQLEKVAIHAGNIYIADTQNHCLRMISSTLVSTFAGWCGFLGASGGTPLLARFNQPKGIAFDSNGVMYVADWNNNLIRKIENGTVSNFTSGLQGFTDGPIATASFKYVNAIAIDKNNNMFVVDEYNHAIRKISGGQVTTVAGTGTAGFVDGIASGAKFNFPRDIAVDLDGNLYVADTFNDRIRKIIF